MINLNASTAAFVTELERVKNLSFDTATQIQRSFSLIGTAALGMLGAFTLSLGEMVTKTTELETHILHLATASGMSVEAMSGLSFVANMYGVEVDGMAKSLEKFDKLLVQAQMGNAGASAKMNLLGIDPATIQTSDQALMALAEHFQGVTGTAEATGQAMLALGGRNVELLTVLAQGPVVLQKWLDLAHELGVTFDKEDAEAAEHFEQNVKILHAEFEGFQIQLEKALLPNLNALTDVFVEQSKQVSGSATLIDILKVSFQSLATGVIVTLDAAKLFGSFMEGMGADFLLRVDGMVDGLAALALAAQGDFAGARQAIADFNASGAAITQNIADTASRNLAIGVQANQQMDAVWGEGTTAAGLFQKTLDALAASMASHQKAVDAMKKSVEGMVATYQTDIATMGMSSLAATEYKLRIDAAKLGLDGWLASELLVIDALDKKKKLLEELGLLDSAEIAASTLRFTQDQVKADQDELAVLKQKADEVMTIANAPQPLVLDPTVSKAFTDSITEQTTALQYQIATFGMSTEAIARYNLAQLGSNVVAQQQIANFKALQDQMSAMNVAAQKNTAEWKTFGEVANKSLDDLIFSGKSFTQVLSDITKQLGEMFLKWSLFGMGNSSASSGEGLFGMLQGLFAGPATDDGLGMFTAFPTAGLGIPGLASGGSVAGGQTIMVGENGPELFTPSTSGAIIPNGGGGGAPQVNVTYQIDARGSSITEAQFQASLAASESRAVARSMNMVKEVQARTA